MIGNDDVYLRCHNPPHRLTAQQLIITPTNSRPRRRPPYPQGNPLSVVNNNCMPYEKVKSPLAITHSRIGHR